MTINRANQVWALDTSDIPMARVGGDDDYVRCSDIHLGR
jgi:hypothetical protein